MKENKNQTGLKSLEIKQKFEPQHYNNNSNKDETVIKRSAHV